MDNLKELRVLYAEDDLKTRESMIRILKRFFGELVAVENGEVGLKKFKEYLSKKEPFDIVITDINMPVMNGIDMIRSIRELDVTIPILLVTAHSEANHLFDAINLNVSQYVVKPVNLTIFVEKIKTAYLPIQQKKELEMRNEELLSLNNKIKQIAKREFEDIKKLLPDNLDKDFNNIFENISIMKN